MVEKMTWGVMGNATIAQVCVIPAIQKSTNGVVRALASRSPQKASDVVVKYGIERVYGDYQALLEDSTIEAIYLPLPNHLHHKWSLRALAAGKHVLCEKPLACNVKEAEEMAITAERSNRMLMEGFMYRFHPRSKQVCRLVHTGKIGAPRLIRSAFCYHMNTTDYENPDNARLMSRQKGGGAMMDVGCYGVSVARWLFDAEPVHVQCQASFHPGGADVHSVALLAFGDGRLATVEASMVAGLQQTYSAVGDKGVIDLPHDAFIPWEKDALYTLREKDAEEAEPRVIPGADEYQLMVEHFVDAIRGVTPLDFSVKESIANLRVLDALAEAAATGNTVKV